MRPLGDDKTVSVQANTINQALLFFSLCVETVLCFTIYNDDGIFNPFHACNSIGGVYNIERALGGIFFFFYNPAIYFIFNFVGII